MENLKSTMPAEASACEIRPSAEEHRPQIDFDIRPNIDYDWLAVDEVLRLEASLEAFPVDLRLVIREEASIKWHSYSVPGTSGIFSDEFVNCVGEVGLRDFVTLPVFVNESRYHFLRIKRRTDCLDLTRSVVEFFDQESKEIMDYDKLAFNGDSVPLDALFAVPELDELFAGPRLCKRIESLSLAGVRLVKHY